MKTQPTTEPRETDLGAMGPSKIPQVLENMVFLAICEYAKPPERKHAMTAKPDT